MDQGTGRGAAESVASLASRAAQQRWRRLDPQLKHVVALTAAPLRIAPERLFERGRGCAGLARARQLAMYLCHVGLGRTLTSVGEAFGRDRSTASYACARIEDLREDARFEAQVAALEEQLVRERDDRSAMGSANRAAG